eukprot:comp12178_c0_seq1/m.6936 comp12178_c0_seq1/g.6936  ORF comp12178_c0_seq1/g.6936 comp12178_c0_seq1/m.6936 type:complete len:163 (-) comp12178_c0_seq1:414-902(-)
MVADTFPSNRDQLIADLGGFLTPDGVIAGWPGKKHRALKDLMIAYVWSRLETGKRFTEAEITAAISEAVGSCGGDVIILRRELFEAGLLGREGDGSSYWVKEEGIESNPWTRDRAWIGEVKGRAEKQRDPSSLAWKVQEVTGEAGTGASKKITGFLDWMDDE